MPQTSPISWIILILVIGSTLTFIYSNQQKTELNSSPNNISSTHNNIISW